MWCQINISVLYTLPEATSRSHIHITHIHYVYIYLGNPKLYHFSTYWCAASASHCSYYCWSMDDGRVWRGTYYSCLWSLVIALMMMLPWHHWTILADVGYLGWIRWPPGVIRVSFPWKQSLYINNWLIEIRITFPTISGLVSYTLTLFHQNMQIKN